MENNTLAVLVAVILMGFTAVAMITTAEIKPLGHTSIRYDASFHDRETSDLGKTYVSN